MRDFTVLPNFVLQYRQLSYTARGLLVDLLSRPDGWREDGRRMADTSPQGRGTVRKALKELADAGFYRVEKIRMPDGTIRTETHVFDVPSPGGTLPGPGGRADGRPDAPSKNPEKEPPSLPAADAPPQAAPSEHVREAMATLFRVLRPEPRLRLGQAEAAVLAPLVAQWLERGSTPADLATALLPGLPSPVHSPVALLRSRLRRKMPPERTAVAARYAECGRCHDPVPAPGICGPCAGLGMRRPDVGGGAAATPGGVARARAALHAARAAVADVGVPAVAG